MSYLVMESRTGYAVVLDNGGRFQKVPNLGYEVGEVLDYVTVFPEETGAVTPFRKKMASLAAAAACFLVLAAGSHQMLLTAYGTVRLRINPDVMMEINRLDYVIGLEGLNEDGVSLIEGYGYRGKRLEAVSEELADLAMEEGYLKDGGEIVLTVESKHEKWRTEKETALTEKISTHLENKASVKVSAGQPDQPDQGSGAGRADLSPEVQSSGPNGAPESGAGPESGGNPGSQQTEYWDDDRDDDRDNGRDDGRDDDRDDDQDDDRGDNQDDDRDDDQDDGQDDDRGDDGDSDDAPDHVRDSDRDNDRDAGQDDDVDQDDRSELENGSHGGLNNRSTEGIRYGDPAADSGYDNPGDNRDDDSDNDHGDDSGDDHDDDSDNDHGGDSDDDRDDDSDDDVGDNDDGGDDDDGDDSGSDDDD